MEYIEKLQLKKEKIENELKEINNTNELDNLNQLKELSDRKHELEKEKKKN